MSQYRYSIEARAYNIIGLAAHDFWVLRDGEGHVVGQLHGLATNRKNEIKPIKQLASGPTIAIINSALGLGGSSSIWATPPKMNRVIPFMDIP